MVRFRTKATIFIPYEKGTSEYANFVDSINELLAYNPDYKAEFIDIKPKARKFNPSRRKQK